MPGPNTPERLAAQVGLIKNSFFAAGVRIHNHPPGSGDTEAQYLFRADRVLAPQADADLVGQALAEGFGLDAPPDRENPIEGLTVFTFPMRTAQNLDEVVNSVNDTNGRVVASLDHIVHITSSSCCPATEPQVVTRGDRDPTDPPDPEPKVNSNSNAGNGVDVAVIDTGILTQVVQTHTWLSSAPAVDGDPEKPQLGHYKGHGSFVAGVLRAMAPKAHVYVHSIMSTGGAISESDLAPMLVEVLDTNPDIISMSAGTRTTAANVLLALQAFRDNYLSKTDTLLVCAAGNDGNFGPFAPASLDWPEGIAVGALEKDGTLAPYSNRGPVGRDWVDVYARGSDIVNAYPNGPYKYVEPESVPPVIATFVNGMASWSGTSFSTPLVAGLIAEWLSNNPGTKPKDAWAALLLQAQANAPAHGGRPTLP